MIPIQPDQEAAIRQFAVEVAGSRWADFEASQWSMSTHVEGVWTQATPRCSMSVVYLKADDLGRTLTELATSPNPFAVWCRQHILEMHGIDFSEL